MSATDEYASADIASQYLELSKDLSTSGGVAKFLKFCRSSKSGNVAQIATIAKQCRKGGKFGGEATFGNEYWLILEQLAVASVFVGDAETASSCVTELEAKFGVESTRLARLRGMVAEVSSSSSSARTKALYEEELKKNPNNAALLKRIIAIHKRDGDYIGAAKLLSEYLERFCGDVEGWLEMADLQLLLTTTSQQQQPAGSGSSASTTSAAMTKFTRSSLNNNRVAQAIFCMDELLLLQPNNAAFHTRVAELICRNVSDARSSSASANNNSSSGSGDGAAVTFSQRETELRTARLHACEAVRLTRKNNAYALASLADSTYLHWCCVVYKSAPPLLLRDGHAVRLLYGDPLSDAARLHPLAFGSAAASSSGTSSSSSTTSSSSSSTAAAASTTTSLDQVDIAAAAEDRNLHSLAVFHLQRLAAESVKNNSNSNSSNAELREVYPAVALESILTSKDAIAAALKQETEMER